MNTIPCNKDGNKITQSLLHSIKPWLKNYPCISKATAWAIASILRINKVKINEIGAKGQFFMDNPSLENIVKLQEKLYPNLTIKWKENLPISWWYEVYFNHPTGIPDGVVALSILEKLKRPEQDLKTLATAEVQALPFVEPIKVFNWAWQKTNIKELYENKVYPMIKEKGWIGMLFASWMVQRQWLDEEIIKYTWDHKHPELSIPWDQRQIKEFRHQYRYVQAARNMKVPVVPIYLDFQAPNEMYSDMWWTGLKWHIKRARALVNMALHDYKDMKAIIRKPIYPDELQSIYKSYGFKENQTDEEHKKIHFKVTSDLQKYLMSGEKKVN